MTDASKTRVLVIKNGVAKELHNLPETIMAQLEEAYDKQPIRGLSRETYGALADFFDVRLKAYRRELVATDATGFGMFARSVAFAKAFEIFSEESPAFFEMLLNIERSIEERADFDSRSISMKNMRNMTGMDWKDANKDFRRWSRRLFEETGLKIGIVRMSKFFYGVVTQLQTA